MAVFSLESLEASAKSAGVGGRFINPSKIEGECRMRFIGTGISGLLGWTTDNKPARFELKPEELPENIKCEPGKSPLRGFHSHAVYDYSTDEFKIFEWTQLTISEQIGKFMKDEDFGLDITSYDIKLSRTGEGLKTEYHVVAAPPKPIPKAIQDRWDTTYCNLNALFDGLDPWTDPLA
ncbi:MAG: hypothetical protein ACO3PY_05770 [Pontimonas sp.]